MPYKETRIEKVYYSIGEVAEMFHVKPSLIRYWEKEFDILKPHKNNKGTRFFTREDIRNFHLIYHLVKERGMTIKGARQKLKENREETESTFEVVRILQKVKDMLLEIKDSI
ncbi:MAG: MerR family transcriptional regulator [Bacteroidales bacterium]|nr:MerR family transcriptional regulator [Bacteroidales bacterium]HQH40335.1 MerR family transcriptional regulator [Bacteroidales bacterium]